MSEIWKTMSNGVYEVSSHGNIRSLSRVTVSKKGVHLKIKGRTLKKNKNSSGYHTFAICINGKSYTESVHRAVMITFNGLVKGMDVNHIDGNKQNNRLENLEWMTRKENIDHAHKNGLSLPINKRLLLKRLDS